MHENAGTTTTAYPAPAPSLAVTAVSPSHRPDQAQRIIDRGVDVARGDRVADAES